MLFIYCRAFCSFCKDDFVVEDAGDLLKPKEAAEREKSYSEDSEKGCYMYYFQWKDKRWCVDATAESGKLGRLINHSRQLANCRTRVVALDDLPRLCFFALRDIAVGEELCYDYGDRDPVALAAHPWLKS